MKTQLKGITMAAVTEIVLAYKDTKKKKKGKGKGETCVLGKRPSPAVPECFKTHRI